MLTNTLDVGVKNLVQNCAELSDGAHLLILHEPSGLGYYSETLADSVAMAAKELGLRVTMAEVPFSPRVADPDASTEDLMRGADCTLFLARLGDQIRFRAALADVRAVVCYALDEAMFASDFGRVDYRAFLTLKQMIDRAMLGADHIHVTCPLGTDFSGRLNSGAGPQADVNIRRFPMSVFTPNSATQFSGRVAQAGFLTGTGSNYYTPYACDLGETLFIEFDSNRITGFDGAPDDMERAKAHYAFVSETFGIDEFFMHSWHAGIHPGCSYTAPASAGFERWSGSAFGNPRLLHLHTCGAYAPGEISLNVLDPTIRLDGVAVWQDGRFYPDRVPGGQSCCSNTPILRPVSTPLPPIAGKAPQDN